MAPTVLIVEDDADIRNDLAAILEDEGYSVMRAAHGAEALDHLNSSKHPNAILLDLMMPVMDGWQLRGELLKDPALARIPIIVLSGVADPRRETTLLGAAGYVNKPLKLAHLLNLLAEHC